MPDTTFFIDRIELERVFSPRAVRQFEELQQKLAETEERSTVSVGATETLQQGTFVTLSPNAELPNEYVLGVGSGLRLEAGSGTLTLYSDAPRVTGGFTASFAVTGPTALALPLTGILATRANVETLENKTLTAPKLSGLVDAVDDAAAAGGGVPVGGAYRNGSVLMVRVA